MIDGLPIDLLSDLDVVALGLIVVWAIATGRLVTRREHQTALHDRDEWRTEARLKDQTIGELTTQNRAMLDAFGPTLTDFLRSLRRAGVGTEDDER